MKLGQEKEEAEPLTRDDSWRQSAPVREWDIGKESKYCVLPALMHMKIHWLYGSYKYTRDTIPFVVQRIFSTFYFYHYEAEGKWVRDSHPASTILISRHFKLKWAYTDRCYWAHNATAIPMPDDWPVSADVQAVFLANAQNRREADCPGSCWMAENLSGKTISVNRSKNMFNVIFSVSIILPCKAQLYV